jgi:hypothetical protein
MARLLPMLLVLLLVFIVGTWMLRVARHRVARARAARATGSPGGYRWDRRSDQIARRVRAITGPDDPSSGLDAWLDAHDGVEAYVEPRTVVSPRSVVLVDGEGRWRRFVLHEDRALRELARERRLPVFDASRTGYPPRMRRTSG